MGARQIFREKLSRRIVIAPVKPGANGVFGGLAAADLAYDVFRLAHPEADDCRIFKDCFLKAGQRVALHGDTFRDDAPDDDVLPRLLPGVKSTSGGVEIRSREYVLILMRQYAFDVGHGDFGK